jgi:SAM-dependent methyltransferase
MPLLGVAVDPTPLVAAFLEQLDAARLVISEKGRYLGLAIRHARRAAVTTGKTSSRRLVYDPAAAESLKSLYATLLQLDYPAIANTITDGADTHDIRRAIRRRRFMPRPEHVDAERWILLSLFLLGQPVPEAKLRILLGTNVDRLLDLGLVALDPPWIRCERYAIVPIEGWLFVVSRLAEERADSESVAVYVGLDTRELIDYASHSRAASILDLGCGGGLVGITQLRQRPCRVVGVDACHEAVEAARVNAAMHGVEYEVREGDLYEPVTGERFDLIVADPPALALPDELAFPIYGAGGTDGDLLFRRIVSGAPEHLTDGGRLVAITELQCTPGSIPFLEWSRQWVSAADGRVMRVEVRGARHLTANYHRALGGALGYLPGGAPAARQPDAVNRLVAFAAGRRLRMGYWVHVELRSPPGPSRLEVEWLIARADADSRPRLALRADEIDGQMQAIYGQPVNAFEPVVAEFLSRLNGNDRIADIAVTVSRSGIEPTDSAECLTAYFVDLATAFNQVGLIYLEPEFVGQPR